MSTTSGIFQIFIDNAPENGLTLFPAEFYNIIPEDFVCTDIHGEKFHFKKGETSQDWRENEVGIPLLSYGILKGKLPEVDQLEKLFEQKEEERESRFWKGTHTVFDNKKYFPRDLPLWEQVKKLEENSKDANQLGEIRATLFVNFSAENKGRLPQLVDDSMSTFAMLIKVLEYYTMTIKESKPE